MENFSYFYSSQAVPACPGRDKFERGGKVLESDEGTWLRNPPNSSN
jgi:hypothetical protein